MTEFDGILEQNGTMNAAYIRIPFSIEEKFGKKRLLVHAWFDDVPYDGQIVRMKTPYWLIGVNQSIRKQLGKSFGDSVHVRFEER